MHFSKVATAVAIFGTAFAHMPGSVSNKKRAVHIEERQAGCTHNNLLRALIRGGNDTAQFCSSYLGGSIVATVTTTIPGGATTADVTVTENPIVTEVVTDVV
jgi:hypothetical protein